MSFGRCSWLRLLGKDRRAECCPKREKSPLANAIYLAICQGSIVRHSIFFTFILLLLLFLLLLSFLFSFNLLLLLFLLFLLFLSYFYFFHFLLFLLLLCPTMLHGRWRNKSHLQAEIFLFVLDNIRPFDPFPAILIKSTSMYKYSQGLFTICNVQINNT